MPKQDTEQKLIPFEELQKHIDVFDRVEVNYWDGDPRRLEIEGGGVAVLRVTHISPTHTADGKNVLCIGTDNQWFSKGITRMISQDELNKLHNRI